jgi:cell division protein FtsW
MKKEPRFLKLDRTDTGVLGRWWWTVDRLCFVALLLLLAVGAVLVTAASPPVASRIGLDEFYFVKRQAVFLILGLAMMVGVSLCEARHIRRIGVLGFLAMLGLMALLPFAGSETKGAIRWINLAGFSFQPSEIIKPCFAVVIGWVFAEGHKLREFPAYRVALALYALVAFLLIIQPDFGMVVTVSVMFGAQMFLAGIPIVWVVLMLAVGAGGIVGAYTALPHVTKRIDAFLNPEAGDNYQVEKSLEAFGSGGLFGRGPGEGVVKWSIPDSHTDFIFSVAGEEFGAVVSVLIVLLYGFVLWRGFLRIWREHDLFVLLAAAGILVQFGVQAAINMGVAVHLLPAKGMTLPFLSYGGSSMFGVALGMGMMLGLTRRRYGAPEGQLPQRYQWA